MNVNLVGTGPSTNDVKNQKSSLLDADEDEENLLRLSLL